MNSTSTPNEPTLYPSAYMVLNNKGYTNVTEVEIRASSLALPRCSNVTERKHYYAGTERVAARLGGGGLNALQPVVAIDDELQWKADKLFKQSLDHVNHRVLVENDLNCIMRNKFSPEVLGEWIDGIPYQVRADVETEYWQFKEMVNSMLDDPNNGHEKEVYFYHSDHLGSASWITEGGGMAVQHIQYLPYGEPYINQRPFGYSERFTFTGKERDEETGYGYFGARYMDHELMTMWLSVDPMADKYPAISPYAYCAWNPVKLVDPDGREINPVYSKEGDFLGNTKEGFTSHPLIMNKGDYEMMMDIKGANSISELSEKDVKDNGGITFDDAEKRGALSGIAQEKIVKNIISQYEDPELSQNYGFNAMDLASKINYDADGTKVGNTNFARVSSKSGKFPTMFYFRHNNKAYEFTVENITSSLVYHEWFGHDVMEYGKPNQMARASEGGTHYACYLLVMTSPLWSRTTPSYQEFNQTMFNAFFK